MFKAVAVVATLFSAAVAVLFLSVPIFSRPEASMVTASGLASIGLVGVVAGGVIISGRWLWAGLLLSATYLVLAVFPAGIVTLHWYGLQALVLLGLAVWKLVRGRFAWRQ